MATRPIRQPPATKTDLPCVARLIFLSYLASAYTSSLPSSSSSSSFASSIALQLHSLCLRAVFPLSRFFFSVFSFTHTRLRTCKVREGERKAAESSSFFVDFFSLDCFLLHSCYFCLFDYRAINVSFVHDQEGEMHREIGSHIDFAND